ncbi:dienelactone hydrolase family protein [Flagellimonas allohymeniacidonis]|uniref:Dienelactone hydrolase family protein n=1 Tax=Flagellimonas allohymeniacidonis TaxID=2517819 RepID=A0A4Q8QEC0_9FLAO|nr:dienelactone hydrolase family protein [Allomuricauda hymeniacidonis]TAI48805.1 dienelactone hydrolase family protein [Allomuricauda hymeniacidonis]
MKRLTAFMLCLLVIGMASCKQKSESKTAEEIEAEELPAKVMGQEVTYATDSTNLKGYIAVNENIEGKRPGVLIVHEWWGHNDYVRERADMLAEMGYTAFAVDMYGDGVQANHPDDAGKFAMSVFNNLPEATARFNAALELLKSQESVDPEKIAAIGYCFGGSVALTMANTGADLDAVAAFHSGVQLPVMPSNDLKARVLVCNGAADPFIAEESVEAFKKAMDSVGANYEYVSYPDVKHSFTSKAADANAEKFGLPLAYDADADTKSWASLQKLFEEVFWN